MLHGEQVGLLFEIVEALGEIPVREGELAQVDEGADDEQGDFDGSGAVEEGAAIGALCSVNTWGR